MSKKLSQEELEAVLKVDEDAKIKILPNGDILQMDNKEAHPLKANAAVVEPWMREAGDIISSQEHGGDEDRAEQYALAITEAYAPERARLQERLEAADRLAELVVEWAAIDPNKTVREAQLQDEICDSAGDYLALRDHDKKGKV